MTTTTSRWIWRSLGLLPTAIAILWVAGIAHFRQYSMSSSEWLVVVAFALALHALTRRLQPRPRPLQLPEGINRMNVALLAAGMLGAVAGLLGGLGEWIAEHYVPSDHPLPLRATWHAACAFAAAYCTLLRRLYATAPSATPTLRR